MPTFPKPPIAIFDDTKEFRTRFVLVTKSRNYYDSALSLAVYAETNMGYWIIIDWADKSVDFQKDPERYFKHALIEQHKTLNGAVRAMRELAKTMAGPKPPSTTLKGTICRCKVGVTKVVVKVGDLVTYQYGPGIVWQIVEEGHGTSWDKGRPALCIQPFFSLTEEFTGKVKKKKLVDHECDQLEPFPVEKLRGAYRRLGLVLKKTAP